VNYKINFNKRGLNGYGIDIRLDYTFIGSFIDDFSYGKGLVKYDVGDIYDG
jgi:hypothetical protein